MSLSTLLCEIDDVLAKVNPTYDFTERIAVSLASFATREFARDMRDVAELAPQHWTKVAIMLASIKVGVEIVHYTSYNQRLKTYLSRIEQAIPELPTTADSAEQFSELILQAREALANLGCILAEVDLSYLGEETSAHLTTVVALLQSARGPAAGQALATLSPAACPCSG